jgi:hypothetical protein
MKIMVTFVLAISCLIQTTYSQRLSRDLEKKDQAKRDKVRNPDTEIILNIDQLKKLCECDQAYSGDGQVNSQDVYDMMGTQSLDPVLGLVSTQAGANFCDLTGDGNSDHQDMSLASQILAVFSSGAFSCDSIPKKSHCRSPIASTISGASLWIDDIAYVQYGAKAQAIRVGNNAISMQGSGEVKFYTAPVSQKPDVGYGAVGYGGSPYDDLTFADTLFEYNQRELLGDWEYTESFNLPYSPWGPNNPNPLVPLIVHTANCEADLALKLVPTCKFSMPGTEQLVKMEGAPSYGLFLYGDGFEGDPAKPQCL